MTSLHRALLATLIGFSLAGCSGGGKGATSALPATGGSTTSASKMQSASVSMQIPKTIATQSKNRTPQYVSASTLGVAVWVFVPPATQPVTPTAVADFSATSPACTAGSNGARTCTISIPAPIGSNDTFVVSTYDQVPSGGVPVGNLLSTNTITGVAIVAGQVNTVPLTLNGVPVTLVINPPAVAVPTGQASSFTINVNAKDVDGNYIIGSGSYTNPIALAITGDPNSTLSLSSSTVAAPSGSAITVTFTGGTLGTGTITATATGATSAHTTITASSAVSSVTFTIPGFSTQAVYLVSTGNALIYRFAANASGAATPTSTISGGVPIGVAVDSLYQYVLESNLTIAVYPVGVNGPPVRTISGSNTKLCNPNGIAVYSGTIYVADSCTQSGILEWPSSTAGNVAPSNQIFGGSTGLLGANLIAVSAAGIFVANRQANGNVVEYALGATGNASPVFTVPSGIGSIDTTSGPQGIAVDNSGNLYVSTGGITNGVLVFAPGATTASYTITGNGSMCGPQSIALDATLSTRIWVSNDCYGTGLYQSDVNEYALGSANATNSPIVTFGGPSITGWGVEGCCSAITTGPGFVYSANSANNTITQTTSAGVTVTTTANGSTGAPDHPFGIAFDTVGNLYVADRGLGRVEVFAPGATTATRTFFPLPPARACDFEGIALDAAGDVYVADTCASAILEFSAGATGGVAPILSLTGAGSGLSTPRPNCVGLRR